MTPAKPPYLYRGRMRRILWGMVLLNVILIAVASMNLNHPHGLQAFLAHVNMTIGVVCGALATWRLQLRERAATPPDDEQGGADGRRH